MEVPSNSKPATEEEEEEFLKQGADLKDFTPQAEDESKNFRSLDLSESEEELVSPKRKPAAEMEERKEKRLPAGGGTMTVKQIRLPQSIRKEAESPSAMEASKSPPSTELSAGVSVFVECGCCRCCPYHNAMQEGAATKVDKKNRQKGSIRSRRSKSFTHRGKRNASTSGAVRSRSRPSRILRRLVNGFLPAANHDRALQLISYGFTDALFQSTMLNEEKNDGDQSDESSQS